MLLLRLRPAGDVSGKQLSHVCLYPLFLRRNIRFGNNVGLCGDSNPNYCRTIIPKNIRTRTSFALL